MRPALLALAAAVLGSGCFTAGYLAQAAGGQLELLHLARPLSVATADPQVPERVRALLRKVGAIKRYGQHFGLTPTGNYTHYADLRRSAAVWVVQGAPRLSLEPRRWSFPLVGSVPYLGFFDQAAARAFAERLEREEAIDVTVRTASAYSTLGWFKDPVLSTMIPEGEEAFGALANVILHESVHATVYVPSQSSFNESLASFVADALAWDLVVGRGGLGSEEARAYLAAGARGERYALELQTTSAALTALYASAAPDAQKLERKRELLEGMRRRLGLKRALNNADLAGSRAYATGSDAFERLRRACGGWRGMLEAVKTLKPGDFERPQQAELDGVVERLTARACAVGFGAPEK